MAIVSIRDPDAGETHFAIRRGLFGHDSTLMLRVSDETWVGGLEDIAELAVPINNLGLLVLSQLAGYDLALGPDGLAKRLVQWAGIDVEALRREAERDSETDKASEPKVESEALVGEGSGGGP